MNIFHSSSKLTGNLIDKNAINWTSKIFCEVYEEGFILKEREHTENFADACKNLTNSRDVISFSFQQSLVICQDDQQPPSPAHTTPPFPRIEWNSWRRKKDVPGRLKDFLQLPLQTGLHFCLSSNNRIILG